MFKDQKELVSLSLFSVLFFLIYTLFFSIDILLFLDVFIFFVLFGVFIIAFLFPGIFLAFLLFPGIDLSVDGVLLFDFPLIFIFRAIDNLSLMHQSETGDQDCE